MAILCVSSGDIMIILTKMAKTAKKAIIEVVSYSGATSRKILSSFDIDRAILVLQRILNLPATVLSVS